MPTVVLRTLLAAHPGVVAAGDELVAINFDPSGRAVVGHEYHNRVVFKPPLPQPVAEHSEVPVNIRQHAVEARPRVVGTHGRQIRLRVLRAHYMGQVRGVGGDIAEERLVPVPLNEV